MSEDEVEDLTEGVDGDVEFGTEHEVPPGTSVDYSPTPDEARTEATFERFPLGDFHSGKALWAANYFVLWPLGLALAVEFDVEPVDSLRHCGLDRLHDSHATGLFGPDSGSGCAGSVIGEYLGMSVREWVYPEGEMTETINQDQKENMEAFNEFLLFARGRILAMKPAERRIAIGHLSHNEILSSDQLVMAA